MSVEYWMDSFGEIADQNNIDISGVDLEKVGKDLNSSALVQGEMCGDIGHFIDSKSKNSELDELKAECTKLNEIIRKLGLRYGVSVDTYRSEINYMEPCGSSHWASCSEKI